MLAQAGKIEISSILLLYQFTITHYYQISIYFCLNRLHVKFLEMHRYITEILDQLSNIAVGMGNRFLTELDQFYSDMNLQMIHHHPIN